MYAMLSAVTKAKLVQNPFVTLRSSRSVSSICHDKLGSRVQTYLLSCCQPGDRKRNAVVLKLSNSCFSLLFKITVNWHEVRIPKLRKYTHFKHFCQLFLNKIICKCVFVWEQMVPSFLFLSYILFWWDTVIISVSAGFLQLLFYVSFHIYYISGCFRTQLCHCKKENVALPIISIISKNNYFSFQFAMKYQNFLPLEILLSSYLKARGQGTQFKLLDE